MGDVLLVRYGELALKSPPVRREFETTLRRNLLELFRRAGVGCRVRADRGHLYVEPEEPAAAARIVRRVFGVTSVSPAREIATDRDVIRRELLALADPALGRGRSFAVRARRTGQHPFTSQELAASLGGDVLERWPDRELHVDLDAPDVELWVEVRGPRTYLYTGRQSGPGGLPLGVAGRVVALVDGIRGGLGAYLMMKRGCRCAWVAGGMEGIRVAQTLIRFDPGAEQRELAPEAGEATAELAELADQVRADALVLPMPVESFPEARARWGDRPVFSPTVGLSDEEVADRWRGVEELAG